MPANLIGLTYVDPVRPEHMPHFKYVDLTRTDHALRDWRIVVQGPRVLFVSPPGWTPGRPGKAGDGPSVMIEVARSRLALHWSGTEADVGSVEKWVSPVKDDGKAVRK